MAPPRKLIVGNWKMNTCRADGEALAGAVARLAAASAPAIDIAVCPPAVLLFPVGAKLAGSTVGLGAQDCHAADSGAHTGDIGAKMLADAGCRFVIAGHSERRADHGESDSLVKAKAEAALRHGLVAIVCIGETEAERDAGRALEIVRRQLAGSLPDGAAPDTLVVAYEPVWAIGTGRTPTTAEIAEVHAAIRAALAGRIAGAESVRLLYGGSVKPDNARAILALANVDGALVGGASLKAEDFWAICAAAT